MSMILNREFYFPEVTLLITHYNRSQSLERLLETCSLYSYKFEDIVVSDDCSNQEHSAYLRNLEQRFPFRLITSSKNKGLANNLNKGQDAVNTTYTLYVQEDFIPTKIFGTHFQDALRLMKENQSLDIIRFYSYLKYPYLKPFKNGYSEMVIKPYGTDYHKIYFYSDHPHLRKSTFLEKFGRYKEGIKGDRTEYWMCISVMQNRAKGLFFDNYKSLFVQYNTTSEPSTMTRINWTQSNMVFIKTLRNVYRMLRYNYDIFFSKNNKTVK